MQDACAELSLHLAEVRFGVRSAGEAVRAGAAARADVVTLEGAALTVELDEGGVRALNAAASTPKRYETLSSLLLNESAGFVAAFNGSLAAQLAKVVAEREAEGESGAADADHAVGDAGLAGFDVVFLRHGNTGKAEVDIDRALTERGREQAVSAADFLRGLPVAPLVACSSAGRCVETVTLALRAAGHAFELVTCPSIYDVIFQPSSTAEVWTRLGYAPLRAYRAEGAAICDRFDEYARVCLAEIDGVAAKVVANGARRTLVVCGHAVYLPSLALALATRRNLPQASLDAILDCNTPEAGGYLVTADAARLLP